MAFPSCSLVSPRTQIEMLESSFEDVFLVEKQIEPSEKNTNSMLDLDLSSVNMDAALMTQDQWSMICRDALIVSSQFKALNSEINEDWYADDFDLRTSYCPWESSLLSLPELESSLNIAAQYNIMDLSRLSCGAGELLVESHLNSTMMNSNLFDMDDSLTAIQLLKTPPQRDASFTVPTNNASFTISKNNASFTISKNNASYTIPKAEGSPFYEDCHSLTAANLLKTPPQQNESYAVLKGNNSFTIVKANESYSIAKKSNASYTVSTSPVEISPVPSSASKNSSFSEVAEKFHSLRRSMSSDSVLPLSQEKLRTMSLTARALVPTEPPPQTSSVFSAAVADMRLRPGRAPLTAKGPMRAMLPLGQMMKVTTDEPTVAPAAKKQCQQDLSVSPPLNDTAAMRPAAISTPLNKVVTSRRSISMSPVRRATPVRSPSSGYGRRSPSSGYGQRSPSSGYGQRRPSEATVPRGRLTFAVKDLGTSLNAATVVDKKPVVSAAANPKPAPSATMGSRLKWPTAKGVLQQSGLPKPIAGAKGIPKPVLVASDPNVRISRLRAPSRAIHVLPPSVKGKENRL